MKKIIFSLLFVLSFIVVVSPVFALECKQGNYGSDECWVTAKLRTNDSAQAFKVGTVFVSDFTTPTEQNNSADEAEFYVRAATSRDQGDIVAGVLQSAAGVASGDHVQLLVRGHGQLRVRGACSSGDRLYVFGSTGGGNPGTVDPRPALNSQAASKDKAIAFALETFATQATGDAYITIL